MADQQIQSDALSGLAVEGGDFASLLQKEFKPKSEEARDEVSRAVQTLAQQALSQTQLINADVLKSIEAIIAELDRKLSEQINLIIHHEDFQKLEGAWRGLSYLVNNTETDETLKVRVMNITKADLGKTLKRFKGTAWDQSPIFKKVYEEEYGQFGGEPFGCLVGDYYFDHSPQDAELLGEMAKVSAAALTPFISAASPTLMGMGSWQELSNPRDLTKIFQNTEYAARNYPDAAELVLLAPMKKDLPSEVFTQIYQPPVSKGDGYDRDNLLKADKLLNEAGWVLKGQQRVNATTGQPLSFELLLPASSNSQWVLPFQHSLQRLGINMDIRKVDNSQITNRMRSRDYDMMPRVWRAMPWPSSDLQISWSSEYINSTYNAPGVQSPVIDSLINQIIAAQGNKEKLLPLGRALDRVLTWNYYMLPMWYMAEDRLAWWDKFSQPAVRPVYSLGIDTWWYDVNKAARLPAERR